MKKSQLFIIVIILVALHLHQVFANDIHWEVVTNLNDALKIEVRSDTLFLATTGGFVLYSLKNNSFQKFTAENGLSDNTFQTLTISDKGITVLGTLYGVITFFDNRTGTFKEDFSLSGNEIVSMQTVADTLWIASKKMVAVYLFNNNKNIYEFRDFFTNFNRDFDIFNQIRYFAGRIWVASDNGLFHAPGNFLRNNLKSAENWKFMTTTEGLPNNSIQSLNSAADTLFIGTATGLSKYYAQNFHNFGSTIFKHIYRYQEQLYLDNSKIIYRLDNSQFTEIYSTTVNTINDFTFDSDGFLWVSFREKGLQNPANGKKIKFNGPIDNALGHMVLNSRGELWIASGIWMDQSGRGFSVRGADGKWTNYRFLGSWRSTSSTQRTFEDAEGNMWVGSWNGGMFIVTPQGKFYNFNNYQTEGQLWISSIAEDDTVTYGPPDSVRHFLGYTTNTPNLLVVTDFMLDEARQCIWIMTPAVSDEKTIVCYKGTSFSNAAFDSSAWDRISLSEHTTASGAPAAVITKDIFNNLWIGTDKNGVVAIRSNDGTTEWAQYTENNNLKNNSCFAIAGDQDGYVWLGTISGLNAYFNGTIYDFREDYQPIGLNINAIYVDSENNKWFATDRGLSLLLSRGSPWDAHSWRHFVPKSSDLVGYNIYPTNLPHQYIRSVFVDNYTGDVYCSTLGGLAILRGNPFTTPLEKLDKIKVGPNPFLISDGKDNYIYFRNLTANSELKILTATGRLVRSMDLKNSVDFLGSLARWNCRNAEGRLVSSGVYLYLITDENGNSSSGKFMIIRE